MRNVLEQSRMELVPLEEELENIRLYLVIESLRFEDKFSHHIELAPDILPDTIFVPPMIIQPFIENAIWHGLLLKKGEKELRIHIFTVDDYLHIEIDDNGIGREEAKNYSTTKLKKESLGMKITMERLHLLEQNQNIKTYIRIDDKYAAGKIPAGTKATIQLPIIKKSL
jgi:LytS/YehU family sensor histidine kinase